MRELANPGETWTPFYLIESRDGWLIVLASSGRSMSKIREWHARKLSDGTETLAFTCESSSMVTSLDAFSDRRRIWGVHYYGGEGIDEITIDGDPPPLVERIVAECEEDQAGEDDELADWLYAAPARIGFWLTGFDVDGATDLPKNRSALRSSSSLRTPGPELSCSPRAATPSNDAPRGRPRRDRRPVDRRPSERDTSTPPKPAGRDLGRRSVRLLDVGRGRPVGRDPHRRLRPHPRRRHDHRRGVHRQRRALRRVPLDSLSWYRRPL